MLRSDFNVRSAVKSFDPAIPGTAEEIWQQALATAPSWVPHNPSLLIVSPHPDDEILGAGALMRVCAGRGQLVTVLSVTRGEAAYANWPDLGRVRAQELKDALKVLSDAPIRVVALNLPDGHVRHYTRQLTRCIALLTHERTTLIAPYEHDGHPDHEACGRAAREAADRTGAQLAFYPVWSWHHSHPSAFVHARWRRFLVDAPTQSAKARALDCYASQLRPMRHAPIVPQHLTRYFCRSFEAFLA
jgi:LmbE family N-acetylglucosaminyl deacetylase